MRSITRKVWSHVSLTRGDRQYVREVRTSSPRRVTTFPQLVEQMARVSYNNPEYSLFFRGQQQDYTVEEGSTIMPSQFRLNGVGRGTRRSRRILLGHIAALRNHGDANAGSDNVAEGCSLLRHGLWHTRWRTLCARAASSQREHLLLC